MKDEDHGESCNPLSLERQPEPRLDGADESARCTPLNNFFILDNTFNNNKQQEVPSALGVSVSVSQMGGRKQKVV
jgi:hemolysin activation/secretion protein